MPATPLNYALPWQGLAAGGNALAGLGGDPQQAMQQLGPLYAQQYQAALGMNTAMNQGVQTGYDTLRKDTDQVYGNIMTNLESRYGDVLGRIAGSNQSNITDINTHYGAQAGAASQQMVNRGLGNSTIQANLQRGIALDRARAQTDSENKFAQLGAGFADRIWSDKTAAQQARAGLAAQLGTAQLGAQERINAGYPDAAMYGSLAQMYGAQAQRQGDQRAMRNSWTTGGGGAVAGNASAASPWGSRFMGGGGSSWGGDSWTGNYGGGGGGGYYQPTQIAQSRTTYADPYTAAMGGAAAYGMPAYDPANWTSNDQSAYENSMYPAYTGGGGWDNSSYPELDMTG